MVENSSYPETGNKQIMYLLNVGEGYISWIARKLSPDASLSQSATEVKSRILNELADWAESLRAIASTIARRTNFRMTYLRSPPQITLTKQSVSPQDKSTIAF